MPLVRPVEFLKQTATGVSDLRDCATGFLRLPDAHWCPRALCRRSWPVDLVYVWGERDVSGHHRLIGGPSMPPQKEHCVRGSFPVDGIPPMCSWFGLPIGSLRFWMDVSIQWMSLSFYSGRNWWMCLVGESSFLFFQFVTSWFEFYFFMKFLHFLLQYALTIYLLVGDLRMLSIAIVSSYYPSIMWFCISIPQDTTEFELIINHYVENSHLCVTPLLIINLFMFQCWIYKHATYSLVATHKRIRILF